jgi:hypothetical protein
MGDPAEENDPPPESKGFLTNGAPSVNCKNQKKYSSTGRSIVLRQFVISSTWAAIVDCHAAG